MISRNINRNDVKGMIKRYKTKEGKNQRGITNMNRKKK